MEMSVQDLLTIISRSFFLLLGTVSFLDFLRQRDAIKRDIMFALGSIALNTAIIVIDSISPLPSFIKTLGTLSLLAQPVLFLRLSHYLQPVPSFFHRFALITMLLIWALQLSPMESEIRRLFHYLSVIVYFVLINGYVMLRFIQTFRKSSGILRQRLLLCAIGTGLLAAALFLLLPFYLLPDFTATLRIPVQLVTIMAALSLLLGISPPRWLQQYWQLSELRNFLIQINLDSATAWLTSRDFLAELALAANRMTGGLGSLVLEQRQAESNWQIAYTSPSLVVPQDLTAVNVFLKEAWKKQSIVYASNRASLSPVWCDLLESLNAQAFLLLPIRNPEYLVLIFLAQPLLFSDDDQRLMSLLAQQAGAILENIDLVEQLKNYSEVLEQKVRERSTELEKSEERFRDIFEQAAVGIAEVALHGRFLQINQRFCEILGYEDEELRKLTFQEITHPDDLEADLAQMEELLVGRIKTCTMQKRYIHKTGENVWARLTVSLAKQTKASPGHFIKVVEDINEQVLVESALIESENRYHNIIDNMMEGFQIIGFDWTYLYLNDAAALHGRVPKEELIGYKMLEKYPGIEATENFKLLNRCMTERINQHAEFEFSYADGTSAWFELSVQPVPEGIFVLSLEITARKRNEEAMREMNEALENRVKERTAHLEALNKELEAFSYSVSHDLRAPLRALDGFSQALLEDYQTTLDSDGREYLGLIRFESQRMGRLIDDLIGLARLSRHDLYRENVDISAMVHEIAATLRSRDTQRKVEFIIQENVFSCADPRLVNIVLQNLLGNAWKYSSKVPEARIEFGMQENHLFVRDNGVGFNMAYAHKLFGAFQRLHGATEFEGTGIGLATVQRIIHRHGGVIRAESVINEGATFYFTFGDLEC